MSSFGKLTEYFSLRKSREDIRPGRSTGRRSGSYCCTITQSRSLDRKLQRPVLGKSLTLPSIPQSPVLTRVPQLQESVTRLPSTCSATTDTLTSCKLPPVNPWRTGENLMNASSLGPKLLSSPEEKRLNLQRSFHMRKSISVDNHLSSCHYPLHPPDPQGPKVKSKLRRQFSLGSADRKEFQTPRSIGGLSKLTHRLSLKERSEKKNDAEPAPLEEPAFRPRSLSIEWSSSPKMTQQMRDLQMGQNKKPSGPSSPNAAKRLYRNLSGKFRVNYTSFDESSLAARNEKERLRKSCLFQGNAALFEAVEMQDLDRVQELLKQYSVEELDLNTPNSEGLLPLDIAIMTNNAPIAKTLLQAGAKESPHFMSLESRSLHLSTLVREAEQRVNDLTAQVVNEAPNADCSEKEKQLKSWEWRYRLYKRMKAGFEHARVPDPPTNVRLAVTSSTILQVTFQEPLSVNSAVVTKYKVEWSLSPSFSPNVGEVVIEKLRNLQFNIRGLVSGTRYYVQVSAYNMKGWGPPQTSLPAFAIPSNWREYDGRPPRRRGQAEALDLLLSQVKTSHQHCVCHEPFKNQPQSRKHSVSKSLKHLFHPSSKFLKGLKRGLYLASIFYKDDNVLVTHEDQIPVVEIDDSYSCLLMQDFLWFTKVSCMWDDILWLRQCVTVSQSSCSCILQTRFKMLLAVSQMQDKLAYHRRSSQALPPGLYLGYLKLCSAVDQIRVLVPERLPNILCHVKIRANANVSREEWEWLQTMANVDEPMGNEQDSDCSQSLLLKELQTAVKELMSQVNIPLQEAKDFRLYSQEVLEFGGQVSLLLLLPPSDDVCTAPGQNNPYTPYSGFLTLPLQIFELVHFFTYDREFISQYCQLSALLELESLLSQQSLREAFSDTELTTAKQRHQQVQDYIQQMEEIWREMRWMMDALQHARYKQPSCAVPLTWFLNGSGEIFLKEKAQSTSSHLDYFPSPTPSPETNRKLNTDLLSAPYSDNELLDVKFTNQSSPLLDSHGVSDEEGSSEVFLATDSDYDSSRAQSPKELDLVYSSGQECGRRTIRSFRDGTPDVLQTHEPKVLTQEDDRPQQLYDSDFVLPSRQIELLRITEKRQAYCVRTSSLDFPKQPYKASRKSCPGSVDSSPTESKPTSHRTMRGLRTSTSFTPDNDQPCENSRRIYRTHSVEWTHDFQEPLEPKILSGQGKKNNSVTLRIYPQYETGLSKEMSVKLHITSKTAAREVVKLVVLQMNEISRSMLGTPEGYCYAEDQLDHFALVFTSENNKEQWLDDDFLPFSLQSLWNKGHFSVRIRETSPLHFQYGPATTV
ncbi:ankyrin repeat and fibronectin type-III domain-containing protein 1-like isoform X4 [Dendropsophus ebraccatus]|uniref:ankyrin repeat and fibronectin type-III domain-containing protein 1-like isoform X4 n=1 Tax=Dendropsophus ebraccatus TaxID=150705 RepID=UPI0038317939